jgi:glucan 1,3-beta-glucosidase
MQISVISLLLFTSILSVHSSKIYGVNLGGWLVLESFISPTLWNIFNNTAVVDQWTWCEFAKNHTGAVDQLHHHWDTWVTDEDLANLSSFGITHVRVPVGYWMVMTQEELVYYNEPWINGEWDYLVKGIQMAKKHNLKMAIDLHNAPGGQNPWQHSGHVNINKWGTGDTVNRTLDYLDRLAKKIKDLENNDTTSGVVVALGVLNEPFAWQLAGGISTVQNYYLKAYDVVRKHLSDDKYLIMLDGAFTWNAFDGFMSNSSKYKNVAVDLHRYQCFDPALSVLSWDGHLNYTCHHEKYQLPTITLPTLMGEWSLSWFMEANDPAQRPGIPTNPAEQVFLKKFALAQMNAYEYGNSLGWFFWNFKTETAHLWNYILGVEKGWLPCHLPVQSDVDAVCENYDTQACLYNCEGQTGNICA